MIKVVIKGGIGNQMFQYAYAFMLSKQGYQVVLDVSFLHSERAHSGSDLNAFNITLPVSTSAKTVRPDGFGYRVARRMGMFFGTRLVEPDLRFCEKMCSPKLKSIVEGYFQSEKYFSTFSNDIFNQFTLRSPLSLYSEDVKKKISASPSVSLHFRRGDYVTHQASSEIHGLCELEYYKVALTKLRSEYGPLNVFVFSDDTAWARREFDLSDFFFVDSSVKRHPAEDIHLMSLCSHNIVANSSFSWWGAWLNSNPDKSVIAPRRWFKSEAHEAMAGDIVPSSWTRL